MSKRPIIVISGLTAAGKTTHGRLLSKALDIPFFSASSILWRAAATERGVVGRWSSRWSPEVDAARGDGQLDDHVDRFMTDAVRYSEAGVFDGCFLPWLYLADDVVKIWIESSLESRVRKCIVSHLADDTEMTFPSATEIVEQKDRTSQIALSRSCDARLAPDRDRFHIVADNSDLIPTPTTAAAARGVKAFHPLLLASVQYVLGDSAKRTRSKRLIYLTKDLA